MALIDDINKELASAQSDLATATDQVSTAQAAQVTAQAKVDALNSLSTISPEQLAILDDIVAGEVKADTQAEEIAEIPSEQPPVV